MSRSRVVNKNSKQVTLHGRLHANGNRCVLIQPGFANGVLLKCPGLGVALIADTPGIEVKSGSPLVNVLCEVSGSVMDNEVVLPFDYVLGEITTLTVFGEENQPIPIPLHRVNQLSDRETEDFNYFIQLGRLSDAAELRKRMIERRQAW